MNIYKKALYDKYFVTPETIKKALNDIDWKIRLQAIKEENASVKNLYKALADWNVYVRKMAISHPKTTLSMELFVMISDLNNEVQMLALKKIIKRLINFYY